MVLAPYGPEFEQVRRVIIDAATESRVQLSSIDAALQLDVTETVFSEIMKADLILAVAPSSNANISYEIGLAHASGRPVVLLLDEDTRLPFFANQVGQSLTFSRSSAGLRRLHLALRKLFEDFRQHPGRFRVVVQNPARPATLPNIDLDRLEPRAFENLCFELLTQLGYRRVEWGTKLEDIDVVATLPKKDPDGFEYEELWIISTGLRAPPDILFDMATNEPEYLASRLRRSGIMEKIRIRSPADTAITILLILARESLSTEILQHELRKIDQRPSSQRTPYNFRVRIWDRQHVMALIQQHPQIARKYFSGDGPSQSEFRKSYEQLYLENAALEQKNQATIAALEEEKDRRARAERDAVWKDVAFTAAHKLGNPIFALETNLQSLKRAVGDSPTEARDISTEMASSIEKAKTIIDQFKSLTKAREITPRDTDLLPLLRAASQVATENGVEVKITSDKRSSHAMVDPVRITECFDELFANALHWLDKNDKQILVTVDTPQSPELPQMLNGKVKYTRIRFEDNGQGVPTNDKEKIFSPFYSKYTHGTGLGLSLVQKVIEGSGGVIREIGKPNSGAVFEIFLPQSGQRPIMKD